ncbi:hypothetical protein J1N35_018147 [Gossypium stocksii]|uniref:Uncharacterized protein n=1 Tax=Gossypium stocksii TaxID=47602 RepID=A0A9D3VQD6_9ROSI|nr:hypothetical protein J1N35_018147 [Gossypium stocksii]
MRVDQGDQDARQVNADAFGICSQSPTVERVPRVAVNRGTLADKREASTSQQLSTLKRIDEEAEVVEVGSLDSSKYSAVTFFGDKNGQNYPLPLNNSLVSVPVGLSRSTNGNRFKGWNSISKHNKSLQGSNIRFKAGGSHRVSLKKSMKFLAESISALSKCSLDRLFLRAV